MFHRPFWNLQKWRAFRTPGIFFKSFGPRNFSKKIYTPDFKKKKKLKAYGIAGIYLRGF